MNSETVAPALMKLPQPSQFESFEFLTKQEVPRYPVFCWLDFQIANNDSPVQTTNPYAQ